jgi:hypothetical protein
LKRADNVMLSTDVHVPGTPNRNGNASFRCLLWGDEKIVLRRQ